MITKGMIRAGISAGVVKLIDSPHDNEPACQIGDYWLYYAGSEGTGLTSKEEFKTKGQKKIPGCPLVTADQIFNKEEMGDVGK